MSESPVHETLESIAAKIEALPKSHDERLRKVDDQFADLKAHLSIKIEAVDTKVVQVYDEVIAMRDGSRRNAAEHEAFTSQLENTKSGSSRSSSLAPPHPDRDYLDGRRNALPTVSRRLITFLLS